MSYDAFWELMTETHVLGVSLAELVGKAILVVVVSLLAWGVQRVSVRVARRVLNTAKVPSVSFLLNMLRALIWFLALMTVLKPVFNVEPTAFVAALGVGSLALSLGMQDTVSNVVGGLVLMLTKIIEPGDVILFAGFTGTVTDINWRSTCIVDSYGQVNIIPNSVISKTAFIKLSDATRSCCVVQLSVRHGSDFEVVRKDVQRVARERLGDWVDTNREVWVTVMSLDGGGIACQVSVPLMWGVSQDQARTRLAGGLTEMPWLCKP